MSRLAGRGDHHAVTDGQSEEEVCDVGEFQVGWSPRGAVTQRQHGRAEPAQLPHELGVWYDLLRLSGQTQKQQGEFSVMNHTGLNSNKCVFVCESDHAAAEGAGSGMDVIGQLVLLIRLRSECVQRHGAAVAAEGATAQRFTTAARLQSHRAIHRRHLVLLRLVHLQPAS